MSGLEIIAGLIIEHGVEYTLKQLNSKNYIKHAISKTVNRFEGGFSRIDEDLNYWVKSNDFKKFLNSASKGKSKKEIIEKGTGNFLKKTTFQRKEDANKALSFFLQSLLDEIYNSSEGNAVMMNRHEQIRNDLIKKLKSLEDSVNDLKNDTDYNENNKKGRAEIPSELSERTRNIEEGLAKVLHIVSKDDKNIESNLGTKSNEIVDEVESLLESGRFDDVRKKAKSELGKLKIGENPDLECRLYRFIANTYLKGPNNQQEAIPYIDKVIVTCSDDIILERNKTLKYLLERNFELAEKHVDNLIQLDNSSKTIGLKANILWAKGENEKAIKLLKLHAFNDDAEYHYYLSNAYLESESYDKALQSAEKAINLDEGKKHYLELFVQIVIRRYQSSIPQKNSIWASQEETNFLKRAIEYSSDIIASTNEQDKERVFKAYTDRGILRYWIGDNELSIEDLLKAKDIVPDDTQLLRNLANIYAAKGDYEEALNILDSLWDYVPDDIAMISLKALSLLEMKEPEKAIEFLEGKIDLQNINVEKIELYKHLISAYDAAHEAIKADNLIEKLENKLPDNTTIAFAKVDRLEWYEKYNEAVQILERIKNVSGKNVLLLKYKKASIYYMLGTIEGYKESAKLYEDICNPKIDSQETYRYAVSLYNSKDYIKCLQVCKTVQSENGFNKYYSELEADIYYWFENFMPASENYRVLSIKYPEVVRYSIRYAICLYCRGSRPFPTQGH